MSTQTTPDLLTTHQYICGALNEFADVTTDQHVHRMVTKTLDAHELVPAPHVIEGTLEAPVLVDDESGEPSIAGPQQLTVSLWGEAVPIKTDAKNDVRGTRRLNFETDTQEPLLAQAIFTVSGRRARLLQGSIDPHGEAIGMDAARGRDGTKNNLMLARLSSLVGKRLLGIPTAAKFVEGVSLETGHSRHITQEELDVLGIAQEIHDVSGKSIPESLFSAPLIQIARTAVIAPDLSDPGWVANRVTLDHNVNLEGTSHRAFTDYQYMQYEGFCPLDDQSLGYYTIGTPDGQPTSISLSIDVGQRVLGTNGYEGRATSDDEARQLMSPFINAITGLRRYRNAAAKLLETV